MADKDYITRCGICGLAPVGGDFPRRVCPRCDALALNDAARPAHATADGADGDNPVSIEGKQCWRHYRAGGWVTMVDVDNCRDLFEFCKRNDLPIEE